MAISQRPLRSIRSSKAIDEFANYENALGKEPEQVKKRFDEHRRAFAEGGESGYWMKCRDEAEKIGDLYLQAQCNAKLENYDQALTLLEEVYSKQKPPLQNFFWDECWGPVHTNSRFIRLLKRVGLKK